LKTFFAEQNVTLFMVMFVQTALSLLKSQVQLLQLRLLAPWTSVTAAVVLVKAAVAVQIVVHLAVVHVTSAVVQTAVVHEVALETVHAQVEDHPASLLVSHQDDLLAIAKSRH
jgi:hypothetical protein